MTEKTGSSGYNLGKQWLGNSRVTELQLPGIAENLRRVTRNKKRRTLHDILKVEYLEKIKNI